MEGHGGDEHSRSIDCVSTGHLSSGSCGLPPRVVSVDVDVCADCEVHHQGLVPHTNRCEAMGTFSNVYSCIAVVCAAPQEYIRNTALVELDFVPTCRRTFPCLSAKKLECASDEGFAVDQTKPSSMKFNGDRVAVGLVST